MCSALGMVFQMFMVIAFGAIVIATLGVSGMILYQMYQDEIGRFRKWK